MSKIQLVFSFLITFPPDPHKPACISAEIRDISIVQITSFSFFLISHSTFQFVVAEGITFLPITDWIDLFWLILSLKISRHAHNLYGRPSGHIRCWMCRPRYQSQTLGHKKLNDWNTVAVLLPHSQDGMRIVPGNLKLKMLFTEDIQFPSTILSARKTVNNCATKE